ncbi:hypothetical protein AB0A81_28150 [Streptomyces flaveolus]|uniref:Uncharacterized protein n=1 Tax=Streptomyces flaveolus TaxID=67297 RepID=A0ABV1VBH9_9ACTN
MTPQEHEDGMRQERTLSAAEKADGFAAVMKRLKSRSPQERAQLEREAEEVVLGHEAYALGQEHLDRGDYETARRWLRVAVDRQIPGAAETLEEIALRQAFDGFTDVATVVGDHAATGSVPCETISSPHGPRAKAGQHGLGGLVWPSFVERFYPDQTVAAVRAQARREADAILADARQQADRAAAACAEMVLDVEEKRKQATELLAGARQEAESVRSQVVEIVEETRRSSAEVLAKAQRQALLILDDAREEAAKIRDRARRQDGAPNRAGNGSLVRRYRTALTQCAIESMDDLFTSFFDSTGGPAGGLPVTTRPDQGALERLRHVPFSLSGASVVLITEGVADSSIWLGVHAPQERGEQDGTGPRSQSGTWQVLKVAAGSWDARFDAFDSAYRACSGSAEAVRQDWLRLFAIGVVKTEGEDTDGDAELDVQEVENSASR